MERSARGGEAIRAKVLKWSDTVASEYKQGRT